jgi:hypothetical protein
MTGLLEVVRIQFADSCDRLGRILAGLEDDEFFWEPVDGCWTVHRRDDDRGVTADGAGDWVIDYVLPEPDPAPVTTIAWRVIHMAGDNEVYWDHAFGTGALTFDLQIPGTASEATRWLRDTQQRLLDTLDGLTERDLDKPVATNWGDAWPTYRIFTAMTHEQYHHGAEVSLLRDLYRHRPLRAATSRQ